MAARPPAARPDPRPGLRSRQFQRISANGLGDPYNSYAYSAAWFQEHLYIGTGRANLCLLKFAMPYVSIDTWPIDCPHRNYTPEFEQQAARGEIWRHHPKSRQWQRCYQAPLVSDPHDGCTYSRDLGYRAMTVFQGTSDAEPALYVASWSRSRGTGPELLRSQDGQHFETLPNPRFTSQDQALVVTAIRTLVPFKGQLFTAPTGASKGNVNAAWNSLIFATRDPASGRWQSVNDPGFDSPPEVIVVYEMAVCHGYLYAGTGGANGFQLWRTRAEGDPPYQWEKILEGGAGRGALNQGTVSLIAFGEHLYIGTGIQNGGYDHRFQVGPAAAEILRVHENGDWDIVVGNARDGKEPLSAMGAGFNNYFCGYIWRFGVHDGWLYAGTMDWTVILRYVDLSAKPWKSSKLLAAAGVEDFIAMQGGFDLWRSWDGENWINVTRTGFDNAFNYGCRNLISSPHGLFVGTANPFAPQVATQSDGAWTYRDNPAGGLEVLLGTPHPI
ncbi:hypothetical protein, partial [Rhabdochromatium marinum]|uniref:hypothetical protein n=1 Tax=Rhabdochromatium marinum TaxID=48729 RepID=UPI00190844ED|nr:hypothetical protein [Rhabdochromatium marinum]